MTEADALALILGAMGVLVLLLFIALILYGLGQRRRVSHKPRLSPEQQIVRKKQVKSLIDKIGKL